MIYIFYLEYWYRPFNCWDNYESGDDCLINGRKRARFDDFFFWFTLINSNWEAIQRKIKLKFVCRNDVLGSSWKVLFKLRWPEFIDHVESPADWQQLYWEKHLQKYANLMKWSMICCSRFHFFLTFMLIRVTVVLMKQLK